MFRRTVLVIAALAVSSAAVACSSSQQEPEARATTASSAGSDELRFSAPLVGGGELDMSDYEGSTVALWFWAPT